MDGTPDNGLLPDMAAPLFARHLEDFTCLECGRKVTGTGYTNHCPRCLWSRHVDINPGDRLAECGGAMQPVGALQERKGLVIVHRCAKCGLLRRNRASEADNRTAILALFGKPVPDTRGGSAPARRKSQGEAPRSQH